MTTLIDFLEARLAEDEDAASKAGAVEWIYNGRDPFIKDASGKAVVYDHAAPNWFQASHIARHDPARVLREVQAKRALIDVYTIAHESHDILGDGFIALDKAVHALAAVYSDHPEFRKEWAA